MRIIFMGTPDFAVPCLHKLLEKKNDVCAVFTQPDKPKGRKQVLAAPPVKALALEHGIAVYQPATLRDETVVSQIEALRPDVIVVAAYGKLLPEAVLSVPPMGCVNVHGSLLPKYRGAAPIQWAVINGEPVTGVTTMQMNAGLDTGDILLMRETEIGKRETAGMLFDRLSVMGADLLWETLEKKRAGVLVPLVQDDAKATYAPMLQKENAVINWALTAQEIDNLVRGMNPWPVAFTWLQGKKLKIYEGNVRPEQGVPGQTVEQDGMWLVFCGQGAMELVVIQPENGKRMRAADYLRGHRLPADAYMGRQADA